MFGLLLCQLTLSADYSGLYTTSIDTEISENFTFIDCVFKYIGTYKTSSAVWLDSGTVSQYATLYCCTFVHCCANKGGAFSFTGYFNLNLHSICTYNTSTNDVAGILYIGLYTQPEISYLSCCDCTALCQTMYFLRVGPTISNMNVSSCSATYSKTTTYWSYGVLYTTCTSSIVLKYINFESCYSPDGIVYNKDTTGSYLLQYATFRSNEVDDYSLVYGEDCDGVMVIANSYFVGNTINSKGYFNGDYTVIYLETNVYMDSTYVKGSVTTIGMIYTDSIDLPNYQFFASDYCKAKNALPERSPTFQPTPYNTLAITPHVTPIQTPLNTPYSTAIETPIYTLKETPCVTPYNTETNTPQDTSIETPYETIYKTPSTTFEETPLITMLETNKETPYDSPFETFEQTPYNSPFETNVETPLYTLEETPFYSPVETYKETLFKTPYITFEQTPFNSHSETVKETPFRTLAETLVETPMPTRVPSNNSNAVESNSSSKSKSTKLIIILASICSLILIISLISLIFLFKKKREVSSLSDSYTTYAITETVVNQFSNTNQTVSYDNPLFSTNENDDSDPFRNEFIDDSDTSINTLNN